MHPSSNLNLCLIGASPDTGNQGVTALCHGALAGLAAQGVERVTLFDFGRGPRKAVCRVGSATVAADCYGLVNTRRIYRPESHFRMNLAARSGGMFHPGARAFLRSDAILDASGGDSFSDLYGPRRLAAVVFPKQLALRKRIPLVLLPQTYGPFSAPSSLQTATRIVRGSAMAWARDERSFAALCELAGSEFDRQRHRCGVDMAFLLPAVRPRHLPEPLAAWLDGAGRDRPLAGFNVSGLIFNSLADATRRFGLRADYGKFVVDFLARLLEQSEARVLLLPHVLTAVGHFESDLAACQSVLEMLGPRARERVAILPPDFTASELKWVIGRCSWFCGTRMHATIAALGSGVPTAAAAYSIKTAGVFRSCGLEDQVFELRELETRQLVDRLFEAWENRHATRARLARRLPEVLRQAATQMEEIVTFACRWRAA